MRKLLLASIFCLGGIFSTNAQSLIPDGGFEGGTLGTANVTGWTTFNNVTVIDTQVFNISGGGQKAVTADEGTKYIRLRTDTITISGQLYYQFGYASNRFAYKGKPDSIMFSVMYLQGNAEDRPFMTLNFTKWNTSTNMRDTIVKNYAVSGPNQNIFNVNGNGWYQLSVKLNTLPDPTGYDSISLALRSAGAQSSYGLGATMWVDNIKIFKTNVGIVEETQVTFNNTSSVYPNPFRGSTVINYTLDKAANVTLDVYDLQGRRVSTLVNGMKPAGEHRANFDATDMQPGVYMYKLQAGESVKTERMILVD